MASKTNKDVHSSIVLTPFFDGTNFEYWKIRMRTHLKAEGLWTIVANGFEEPENDGDLTAAEMKDLEAKYRQDAKASKFFISAVVRSPWLSFSLNPFATIVYKLSTFKCVLILIF